MPNSIRVAVASNNEEELDGHFGSCLRFLVYQLSATDLKLIDARSTAKADESDDKNGYRLDLIKDCHVLYVVSIGGPAAAKVVQGGLYPMKVVGGGSARDILGKLQQAIATSPPPWVAKILGVSQSDRLKNYGGDG
jgi:nitrogen fixation protein NifX